MPPAESQVDQDDAELEDDDLPEEVDDQIDDDLPEDDGEPSAESTPEDEPVQQPSQVNTPDWASAFAEYGLNDVPQDPRAIAQQLYQYRQTIQQTAQQNAWLQQQSMLYQQQARQPQPQQVQPKPNAWEPPPFEQEWLNLVTQDADGNLIAKPGVMPDLPQKILAYKSWRDKTSDRFLNDPVKFLDEVYGPKLEERAKQIAEARVRQYDVDAQARQIAQQIEPWAYQRDAQGRVITDAMGNRQTSPYGAIYAQEVYRLHNLGIQDPIEQHRSAEKAVFAAMYQQQVYAPQAQPQVQQAQQQMQILRQGAKKAPPRAEDGKFVKKEEVTKSNLGQVLARRLRTVPREDFTKAS